MSKKDKRMVLNAIDAITLTLPASYKWTTEGRKLYERTIAILKKK